MEWVKQHVTRHPVRRLPGRVNVHSWPELGTFGIFKLFQ